MGMNKAVGNMYEDITHTWNPLAGECFHKCSYCYVNPMKRNDLILHKYSGEPRLREDELKTKLGNGNKIFVCNMTDLFAKNIPSIHIAKILAHCSNWYKNTYLFQTKCPERYFEFLSSFPRNSILGATIESDSFYPEIMGNTPEPMQRSIAMGEISEVFDTFITIEPIMEFHLEHFIKIIKRCNPKSVYIGADSGGNKLPEPSREKILELIEGLKHFTEVKEKKNINRLLK